MKINLKISNTLPYRIVSKGPFLRKQVLATLASSLTSLCTGMTLGITAVMLPQLREDPGHESWIASITCLSMVIGSVSCGTILDSYGRKVTHIILGIPFILGWTVIAFANSTSVILVGRFISGLSSGAFRAVTMVYIGEIVDPKYRAAALFLPSFMLNLGILLCHVFVYYLNWKIACLLCLVPAVIFPIILLFCKESPLWLIAMGRTDEGIQTFRWFRGTDDASEAELKAVIERQSVKPKISLKETLNAVWSKAFMIPIFILTVVMTDSQFSGVNVISFYGLDVFERAFSGNVDSFIMMIIMDCIRNIISFAVCLFGMFVRKRIALLTSSFGVSLFIFALIMCLMINCKRFVWAPVSCFMIFIGFSSAIVSISWSYAPELLPIRARGFGSGLNTAFSLILLFIIVKIAPDFTSTYGESAMFAFYGVSALLCGFILCFVLPETNRKSLQSIEDGYNIKNIKQSSL